MIVITYITATRFSCNAGRQCQDRGQSSEYLFIDFLIFWSKMVATLSSVSLLQKYINNYAYVYYLIGTHILLGNNLINVVE